MTLWLKKSYLILQLKPDLWNFLNSFLLGNWLKSLFWGWSTNLNVSSMSLTYIDIGIYRAYINIAKDIWYRMRAVQGNQPAGGKLYCGLSF